MSLDFIGGDGPHKGGRIHRIGAPVAAAAAAVIMIHGRGASARDILMLASALRRDDVAYLAPQAAGHVWYPQRFLQPTAQNQPWLDSALGAVAGLVADLEAAGLAKSKIVILGFSQGACLATEFAKRHPARYGAIVGLSGGLIGSDAEVESGTGDLAGTPVFLGCSDVDFHIPLERVHATARRLKAMGAAVDERIYPGMEHTVIEEEAEAVRALLATITA